MPWRRAKPTTCARLCRCSLSRILRTWNLTVFSLKPLPGQLAVRGDAADQQLEYLLFAVGQGVRVVRLGRGLGGTEDPVDSRRIYAATLGGNDPNGGVWVGADGGATWSQSGEELRGERITTLATSSIAGVVWAATQDGRIFRSSDSGVSWEERTQDFPAASVHRLMFDPFDPRKLYANTSGGVYMTMDEP
jgi:hypothetical protein